MSQENSGSESIIRMKFTGGYGETESLWVRTLAPEKFEVLSTPVYVYGISPGALIMGKASEGTWTYVSTLANSPGATVRILAGEGRRASDIYASTIRPLGETQGLQFGVCTILDPGIAAISLTDGRRQMVQLSEFFDGLARDGAIALWELADPDINPPVASDEATSRAGVTLVHPPLSPA